MNKKCRCLLVHILNNFFYFHKIEHKAYTTHASSSFIKLNFVREWSNSVPSKKRRHHLPESVYLLQLYISLISPFPWLIYRIKDKKFYFVGRIQQFQQHRHEGLNSHLSGRVFFLVVCQGGKLALL